MRDRAAIRPRHSRTTSARGDPGRWPRAIRYATTAGHESARDLAFEDAVGHLGQALRILDRDPHAEAATRAELLTDYAEALVYVDENTGVDAALPRGGGQPALRIAATVRHAVAVFVEPALTASLYPREAADLFEEAMTTLGDDAPELRARLLAIMAFKYTTAQLRGRDGRVLADEALRAAHHRRSVDPG